MRVAEPEDRAVRARDPVRVAAAERGRIRLVVNLAVHGQPFVAEAEPFIWAIAYAMVEALFITGHDTVVVDATNTNAKARKPWYDRFEREDTTIDLVIIDTPKEVCIRRAIDTNQSYLIPVIERMSSETDIEALK